MPTCCRRCCGEGRDIGRTSVVAGRRGAPFGSVGFSPSRVCRSRSVADAIEVERAQLGGGPTNEKQANDSLHAPGEMRR